jgi:LuxR family transcriptional regulator, maltose regulon positive regulatory protein
MTSGTNSRARGHVAGADDPVLTSKITVPGVPGWAVRRPQIDTLIAHGTRRPLTSVTGPPGSGKTMAIASWAAARSDPATLVWVTLDDYDNRPKIFWSYVVAALRQAGIAVPSVPAGAGRGPTSHVFLLRLASVLAAQDPPVVLVLDDLHLVTDQDILDGLVYMLRNATPGLRLVVSSRMDPLLPLHRYRLTGELTEVRADDLAFSVPESALLMARQGITLSADGVERIVGRTEGWAAGVRLAAISLAGQPDPEQFAKEFDCEEGAVTSYLIDEVLNAQPPATRDFLLRTSILNQVNVDIARELNEGEPAADTLPGLAQTNAFVRSVGNGWYRYHSLFASVLRLKLRREWPGKVAELNRRAAQWYQENGSVSEAVRHAGEAGDWPFAARIALEELATGELIEPRGNRSLAERFQRMPAEPRWTQAHPLLVEAALELSEADGVQDGAAIAAAEAILERLPETDEIPARLAAAQIRLARSLRVGDLDAAVAAVAKAETLLGEITGTLIARHSEVHAQVQAGRGAVELWSGDLDQAAATLRSAIAAASAPEETYLRSGCLGYLALAEALQGRLGHAAELAGQVAGAAENRGDSLAEFTDPAATVAVAYVHLERNELRQARSQLKVADEALRIAPDKPAAAIAALVAARCELADGNTKAASDLLSRARQGWSPPRWLEHRLTLIQSSVCVAAGDTKSAVELAERAGTQSAVDAAVALAQAWLAAGDTQAAGRALAGLASPGEPPERIPLAGWLVDARLSYGRGDAARGRRSLERALRLGRPERLRLAFAMERAWIHPVLRRDPDLARACRDLLEPGKTTPVRLPVPRPAPGQPAPIIVEPLSKREREVLKLVSAMLSTEEIGGRMYISANTVKTHLRSIYRKLSAAGRGEAVRRARELDLI